MTPELQVAIRTLLERIDRLERDVANSLDRLQHLCVARIERAAYTVEQAAARLDYSPWTIRNACRVGRIQAQKASNGKDWLIPHDEILRIEREGL
jgi:hypothetical protein